MPSQPSECKVYKPPSLAGMMVAAVHFFEGDQEVYQGQSRCGPTVSCAIRFTPCYLCCQDLKKITRIGIMYHWCPVSVEQNELVSVAVHVGFEIVCCKAREICAFSMDGEQRESVDRCRARRRVGILLLMTANRI